jgi:hypothetical protein
MHSLERLRREPYTHIIPSVAALPELIRKELATKG